MALSFLSDDAGIDTITIPRDMSVNLCKYPVLLVLLCLPLFEMEGFILRSMMDENENMIKDVSLGMIGVTYIPR